MNFIELQLIAFGLTSPAMLAWLVAAAAPLLIHFFSRRRYRETAWAAMEYLAAAMRQSRRRMRLEQLLLLAVRTLVVVLAVLAVAEPYLHQGGFAFAPGGARTHRMLVVDGSYSMACKDDEGLTRFKRAKAIARRLVEESPAGDGFTLLLMSSPPQVVVGTPALETDVFLAELEELAMRQTTFDLPMTLERVEELLAKARRAAPGLRRAEVYFFTDLGKVGWQPKFSNATSENVFRQRVRRLAKAASVAVIDVGQANIDNRAIIDLRLDAPFVTPARPLGITARVKNFGARPIPEQSLELWVDGRRAAKQNADLAAGGSAAARFEHRFSTPGEHVIEIRTQADRLDIDNRRWLALAVKPCLRVLCVDGNPAAGASGGATAYLKVALAPQEGKTELPRAELMRVCPQVVPESGLMELNLARYDCVFLCNVAQFTSSEARAMARYVEEGGGLVFFMGDRVLPDRYNRRLAESNEEGTRLLPARLEGLVEKRQTGLDPLDYRHPIVEKFRGREQAGLLTTPVAKFFRLSLPEDSKANVVLATNDGEPLIVEEAIGLGRVVLVATSADTSWGPMPMWPSFVPLVHEILAYAVGGQIAERNRLVGDMLQGPIVDAPLSPADGAATTGGSVAIQTPDGQRVKVPVRWHADRLQWSFDDTGISGIYTVEFAQAAAEQAPRRSEHREEKQTPGWGYAVNVDTVESDLTKLSEEQLRGGVFAGVPIEYQTTWSRSEAALLSPIARRGQLAVALLHAVFALLLLESFMAWRFGHHSL